MGFVFWWDNRQAARNLHAHGVTFDEASSAFFDEEYLLAVDPSAFGCEERFILFGLSARLRIVAVVHWYGDAAGTEVHIVSARRATLPEERQYMDRWRL